MVLVHVFLLMVVLLTKIVGTTVLVLWGETLLPQRSQTGVNTPYPENSSRSSILPIYLDLEYGGRSGTRPAPRMPKRPDSKLHGAGPPSRRVLSGIEEVCMRSERRMEPFCLTTLFVTLLLLGVAMTAAWRTRFNKRIPASLQVVALCPKTA